MSDKTLKSISDFIARISEVLDIPESEVEDYFDVGESKDGFFFAVKHQKKWLETTEFKAICNLVRNLNGDYVKEEFTWRVPGPLAKKPETSTQPTQPPEPKHDTTTTPAQDIRSKLVSMQPYQMIPVDAILSMPFQIRQSKDEDPELIETVQQLGVVQPIIVRVKESGRYELVAGSRRLAAAKAAHLPVVPCVVKVLTDREAMEIQYVENDQRKDLTDLERGRWLRELMRRFPETYPTTYALAKRIGKTQPRVHVLMTLAEAAEKEPTISQLIVKHPELTADKAQAILSAPEEKREEILDQIDKTGKVPSASEIHETSRPEPPVTESVAGSEEEGPSVEESTAMPKKLSREPEAAPASKLEIDTGFEWTCPECGEKFQLIHVIFPDGEVKHEFEAKGK